MSDSAANGNAPNATPPPAARQSFTGTPVAQEIPVIATGARTDEASGKRELFKESTTTALVFPNGGVIRLSAALAPGQLLFLTNQNSKREVVAQVTRKRTNPSAGYYIELEFTEAAPNFWGVAFPDSPAAAPAPANAPQTPLVEFELLQSAEPAPDDLSPSAPAPSAAEVQALVEEVEALRAQLRSMQTHEAAPPAAPPSVPPAVPAAPPVPPGSAPSLADMLSSLVAQQGPSQPSPVLPEKISSAPQAEHHPAPAAVSTPFAEVASSAEEKLIAETEDDLLPKPALNFNQAKKSKPAKSTPVATPLQPTLSPAADRSGLLRLALLAVVSLFAVMVAAWNMHLLPWIASPAPSAGATSLPIPSAAKPASPTHPAPQPKAEAQLDAAQPKAAAPQNTEAAPATPSTVAEQPAPSAEAAASAATPTDATTTGPKSVIKENSAPLQPVAKRSAIRPNQPKESVSTPPDDTTAIVPPRLIKSVRAVAPGDALRQFVTGNVTIDALVDASGQVKAMKVLSGPPTFHKAAMDALKQYRYEPARQHGKPVPAHITVLVPFLFEP